ncbi:MAG: ferrous iron transport protein B [Pseudomonadales bacterium]|nr:ferrous iron transport protein B [Pseudomonadales bacterium]
MTKFVVALIGNPNCGKTTLFNALTGAHQKVGNWPGVTVEKKTGSVTLGDHDLEIVDLPGIYSLEQTHLGIDERIAREFLQEGQFDLIINILDATNLERNLVLTQQVMEKTDRVLLALNMLDVAEQNGVTIDTDKLSQRLGVAILPIVASRGTGVDALQEEIQTQLHKASTKAPAPETGPVVAEPTTERLIRRYHIARELTDGVVEVSAVEDTLSERIDRWVLNKWLGIPVFLLMMYGMFTVAINFGAVFIDFFDILLGAFLVDGLRWLMESAGSPEWLTVLAADGLGGGIQLVATFIPVIGFLFLCLSVLEDSGYMARAGFVVDRAMANIGLPGNAFVPLIVGFGCNVPSVMASRTLGRDSDRLLTIAMAPFMSCGARLTVYALFAAAFFPSNGQNVVFLLYLLGIGMAVLTGYIFRKQIFSGDVAPSFQEMPVYHLPVLKNILITTWFRLRSFVVRAGKTIILVVIALSFLNSIATDGSFGHANTEKSTLSVVGKAITPLFAPLGLREENWAATVGLFTGLFAKEAVVGTLDALYSGETETIDGPPDLTGAVAEALNSIVDNGADLVANLGDPLGISIGDVSNMTDVAEAQGIHTQTLSNMAAQFGSQLAAFCYLIFILLYAPCVAVLGAVTKEAGGKWTVLVFSWSTGLAYITASCIYQIGMFSAHPAFSAAWLASCAVIAVLAVRALRTIGTRSLPANLIRVIQVS